MILSQEEKIILANIRDSLPILLEQRKITLEDVATNINREGGQLFEFLMGRSTIAGTNSITCANLIYDVFSYLGYELDEVLTLDPEKLIKEKPSPRSSIYSKELSQNFQKTVYHNIQVLYDRSLVEIIPEPVLQGLGRINRGGPSSIFVIRNYAYISGQKLQDLCTLNLTSQIPPAHRQADHVAKIISNTPRSYFHWDETVPCGYTRPNPYYSSMEGKMLVEKIMLHASEVPIIMPNSSDVPKKSLFSNFMSKIMPKASKVIMGAAATGMAVAPSMAFESAVEIISSDLEKNGKSLLDPSLPKEHTYNALRQLGISGSQILLDIFPYLNKTIAGGVEGLMDRKPKNPNLLSVAAKTLSLPIDVFNGLVRGANDGFKPMIEHAKEGYVALKHIIANVQSSMNNFESRELKHKADITTHFENIPILNMLTEQFIHDADLRMQRSPDLLLRKHKNLGSALDSVGYQQHLNEIYTYLDKDQHTLFKYIQDGKLKKHFALTSENQLYVKEKISVRPNDNNQKTNLKKELGHLKQKMMANLLLQEKGRGSQKRSFSKVKGKLIQAGISSDDLKKISENDFSNRILCLVNEKLEQHFKDQFGSKKKRNIIEGFKGAQSLSNVMADLGALIDNQSLVVIGQSASSTFGMFSAIEKLTGCFSGESSDLSFFESLEPTAMILSCGLKLANLFMNGFGEKDNPFKVIHDGLRVIGNQLKDIKMEIHEIKGILILGFQELFGMLHQISQQLSYLSEQQQATYSLVRQGFTLISEQLRNIHAEMGLYLPQIQEDLKLIIDTNERNFITNLNLNITNQISVVSKLQKQKDFPKSDLFQNLIKLESQLESLTTEDVNGISRFKTMQHNVRHLFGYLACQQESDNEPLGFYFELMSHLLKTDMPSDLNSLQLFPTQPWVKGVGNYLNFLSHSDFETYECDESLAKLKKQLESALKLIKYIGSTPDLFRRLLAFHQQNLDNLQDAINDLYDNFYQKPNVDTKTKADNPYELQKLEDYFQSAEPKAKLELLRTNVDYSHYLLRKFSELGGLSEQAKALIAALPNSKSIMTAKCNFTAYEDKIVGSYIDSNETSAYKNIRVDTLQPSGLSSSLKDVYSLNYDNGMLECFDASLNQTETVEQIDFITCSATSRKFILNSFDLETLTRNEEIDEEISKQPSHVRAMITQFKPAVETNAEHVFASFHNVIDPYGRKLKVRFSGATGCIYIKDLQNNKWLNTKNNYTPINFTHLLLESTQPKATCTFHAPSNCQFFFGHLIHWQIADQVKIETHAYGLKNLAWDKDVFPVLEYSKSLLKQPNQLFTQFVDPNKKNISPAIIVGVIVPGNKTTIHIAINALTVTNIKAPKENEKPRDLASWKNHQWKKVNLITIPISSKNIDQTRAIIITIENDLTLVIACSIRTNENKNTLLITFQKLFKHEPIKYCTFNLPAVHDCPDWQAMTLESIQSGSEENLNVTLLDPKFQTLIFNVDVRRQRIVKRSNGPLIQTTDLKYRPYQNEMVRPVLKGRPIRFNDDHLLRLRNKYPGFFPAHALQVIPSKRDNMDLLYFCHTHNSKIILTPYKLQPVLKIEVQNENICSQIKADTRVETTLEKALNLIKSKLESKIDLIQWEKDERLALELPDAAPVQSQNAVLLDAKQQALRDKQALLDIIEGGWNTFTQLQHLIPELESRQFDFNAPIKNEEPPIVYAAQIGNGIGIVIDNLIDAGCKNLSDKNGSTVLLWLAYHGWSNKVLKLLSDDVLHHFYGPKVTTLTFSGFSRINEVNKWGNNVFICAVSGCHLELAKCIYEKYGASINVKNKKHQNALHFAALRNHEKIVYWLLQEKICAITDTDIDGNTALLSAASRNSLNVVKWLLAGYEDPIFNASIQETNNLGQYAIHIAAEKGHLKTVQWLIESYGVDVDAPCSLHGETALYFAVIAKKLDLVRYLIAHGANPSILVSDKSIFEYAKENDEILQCLHETTYFPGLSGISQTTALEATPSPNSGLMLYYFKSARAGSPEPNLVEEDELDSIPDQDELDITDQSARIPLTHPGISLV